MASLPFRAKSPEPKLQNPQTDMVDDLEGRTKKEATKLSFAAPPLTREDSRRSSIQFNVPETKPTSRHEEFKPLPSAALKATRRMPSPPPERTYQRGVSFDTFDNRDATDFSFTLRYKHKNCQHTRRSRTFLCGTDQNDYSEFALEWMIDELVDDGDEIVCLRVVEKDSKLVAEANMDKAKYREEAQKLLDQVIAKNTQDEKAISLVMELAVGKVQDIIQRMIEIYEPAVLVVGTRGRSLNGMQGLLPGSVSKYCLQQSPIPVIVVRPTNKRLKKKQKRLADPTRRDYNQILSTGGHVLGKPVRESMVEPLPTATDQEAAAVARAVGLSARRNRYAGGAPLSKTTSARSDITSDAESPSPTGPMSPETRAVVLKSPNLEPLDSPQLSGAESEEEDRESEEQQEESEEEEEEEEDIVDRFSKNKSKPTTRSNSKRSTTKRAGKAVGAVVDEVVPKKPPPPPSWDANNAGQNILDILDELTG